LISGVYPWIIIVIKGSKSTGKDGRWVNSVNMVNIVNEINDPDETDDLNGFKEISPGTDILR
jgi:hypothetical protein